MNGLARNLLLGACALAIALAVTEAVLAARGFSFSFAPERVEFGWPNPKILTERYTRDPDLFWVPNDYDERLSAIRVATPDVVFLGDSTTEMGGYPSDFVRMANALSANTAIRGEKLGISGWSSYQGLRQFERDLAPLQPRFATFYFGWNDHWIGFGIEDADIHLVTRSPLAHLQSLRVGQLLMKAHYAWRTGAGLVEHRVPPEDFSRNLAQMVTAARRHGTVPVLLTAPTSHRRGHEPAYLARRWLPDLSQLVPLHERYIEQVRRTAAESQAPLCDLAQAFSLLPTKRVRDELFMSDGIHLTPAGDEVLAAALLQCFRDDSELAALWTENAR